MYDLSWLAIFENQFFDRWFAEGGDYFNIMMNQPFEGVFGNNSCIFCVRGSSSKSKRYTPLTVMQDPQEYRWYRIENHPLSGPTCVLLFAPFLGG